VQTELTSEEKRQTHQKELAEKLNEEARARLAGQKEKTDEKKSVLFCDIYFFIFYCKLRLGPSCGWGQAAVGAKLQATNRVPRPVDRGTATRYGG